ncbi:transcriptional regulator [Pectobacterium araliae]|uniref:helix-turn-helix transcriptional regulator n=1 Tax=Pectobacterium araliae TaxID=3073862 RepID=UPI0020885CF3|nr:transcriptional regulator [Pectobacterium carotovorum subsp. carotovorum]
MGMNLLRNIRRENLIQLIRQHYGDNQRSFANATGVSETTVSLWVNEKKGIGDKSARKIEKITQQKLFWLDSAREWGMFDDDIKSDENDIQEVVAKNLARWMDAHPDLNSQGSVAKAADIAQPTVGRILTKESSVSIKIIEAVARAFGRHGYELLISADDPEVINYDKKKYARLSQDEKEQIEKFIEFMITTKQPE